MGALSDQSFTLDERSYRVLTMLTLDEGLYLNISRELPKDFTLAIGDQEFVASDNLKPATVAAGVIGGRPTTWNGRLATPLP